MMQHYSTKEYNAGISNWEMLQTPDGLMYIANLNGILKFDGTEWQFIEIANGKFVRSLHEDVKGRIFVGSNDEFGFLNTNHFGEVYYQSLSDSLELKRFGLVLQILSIDEDVYFFTRNYLIQKNPTGFKHWKLNRGFGGFIYQDQLYVKEVYQPILKLVNDNLVPLEKNSNDIPSSIRKNIIDGKNTGEKYIIGTSQNKGYVFRNDSIFPTNDQYPFGNSLLSLTRSHTDNNSIWVSTTSKGIFNFTFGDSIYHTINTKSGFPTNININLYADQQNAVWTVHQEGISRISANKNLMFWGKESGINSTISKISNARNKLYLPTLNELYILKKGKTPEKIYNIEDRLLNAFTVNDLIIAIGDNALYSIKDSELHKTIPIKGGTNAFISAEGKLLLTTFRDGILTYAIDTDQIGNFITEISGFCNSILSLGSEHWLSYKSEGIYLINENNGNPTWKFFNQDHGLPDVNSINVLKSADQEILLTTSNGFYTLNNNPKADSSDLFIPHTQITDEKLNISYIDQDKYGNYWLTVIEESQKQVVIKLERNEDGSYQKIEKLFKVIPNQNFSSIYVDEEEDSVLWIAGKEGLYRFDEKEKIDLNIPFNTFIKKVSLNDSVISYGLYKTFNTVDSIPSLVINQAKADIPEIEFVNNNIKFEFSTLYYEQPERNQCAYYLQGFDKNWSNWSNLNNKEYTNLPAGEYIFMVKGRNLYETEGEIATYQFVILPPWYQTNWAYFIFSLIVVSFIWVLLLAYTYRIRQHRKRLKLIIADRTFEVIKQKKVIEEQLLKMQNLNEEISIQRDDIMEKNQELESTQEEVLAINNKLQELNHALEARVEKRTAKIKETIKKLQQTNKDLDTFTYKTSHDLKGPISRIKGILALARFENPAGKSDKYFDLIEKTTKEMDILLGKLTQVHYIYNVKIENKSIDIPTIFKEVMEKISPLVEQSNFTFQFDLQNETELKTDEKMLELILLNLLENAFIYTDQRKEQAFIKLSTGKNTKGYYFSVEDNGLGINEKQLPKIFDMFYRGSERSIGNGLGLYLVKMAVEKIGAKLICKSEEHQFTRFTIIFPSEAENND